MSYTGSSEPVVEVFEAWDAGSETFTQADGIEELGCLATRLARVCIEHLPVIKHALREGPTGSCGAESLREAK